MEKVTDRFSRKAIAAGEENERWQEQVKAIHQPTVTSGHTRQANSILSICYHGSSRSLTLAGIGERERDLVEQLGSDEVSVQIYSESPRFPWYGGSFIAEPFGLILVITGSLIAKTLTQEIIKDLYAYFKDVLKRKRDNKHAPELVDFRVIIDIRIEAEPWYVGIEFIDEETLAIALYRLWSSLPPETAESVKKMSDGHFQEGMYVLDMPYCNHRYLILFVILAVSVWFFSFLAIRKYAHISLFTSIAWSVTLGVLVFLLPAFWVVFIPCYRQRAFRKKFRNFAREWLRSHNVAEGH